MNRSGSCVTAPQFVNASDLRPTNVKYLTWVVSTRHVLAHHACSPNSMLLCSLGCSCLASTHAQVFEVVKAILKHDQVRCVGFTF